MSQLQPEPQWNYEAGSHVRPHNFSHVVSQVLAKMDPSKERASLAQITEYQPGVRSAGAKEVEVLVETLDKLVLEVEDQPVRNSCLRTLSEICRDEIVLPKSCNVPDVVLGEAWKPGRASTIWTGKIGQEDVCIKVFRQHDMEPQRRIKMTFYYHAIRWRHTIHGNVLPFLGVSKICPPFGFVSPRLQNGNILQYIESNKAADRLFLLTGAARGVEYLHSSGIIHGGINPGNILINSDGTPCIGDFGIADIITDPRVTGQRGTTTGRQGTIRYMAPEQINPTKYNMKNSDTVEASDVYSFIMTAYRVLTGIEPYSKINGDAQLAVAINDDIRPLRPENRIAMKWLSEPVWEMMVSCWNSEPRARLLMKDVHQVFENQVAKADSPVSDLKNLPSKEIPKVPVTDEENPKKRGLRGFFDKALDFLRSICCCCCPDSVVQS